MGFRVWGLSEVSGLGFGVWGFRFKVQSRVSGFGLRISGFRFRVYVSGFGSRVSGLGFRVLGFGVAPHASRIVSDSAAILPGMPHPSTGDEPFEQESEW